MKGKLEIGVAMLWSLISWTGWTKEDYIDFFNDVLAKIIVLGIVGLFGYGMFFTAAFIAGC